MAKCRNSAMSDRHDRLLSTFGYDHDGVRQDGGSEFYEEDVCPTMTYDAEPSRTAEPDRPVRTGRSSQTNHRTVYDDDHEQLQFGGLSLAFDHSGDRSGTVIRRHHVDRRVPASAPVDVPEVSKFFRVDPFDSIDNDSTDETEWVPPHEYLAREHGKSVSTSVFEGVGRTLKGRDMSQVRNAVWSRTGFFG